MFQNLASYFLGGTTSQSAGTAETGDSSNRVALRTTDHDDGWTMVDRDSEGNSSEGYSSEEEDNLSETTGLKRVRLNRSNSDESLTHIRATDMEESWFVTPPPCFSSQTGPVHVRTSPLENLLIEHPSMSVYQRTGSRHPRLRSPTPSQPDTHLVEEELIMADSVLQANSEPIVVYRLRGAAPPHPPHHHHHHRCNPVVHLNEVQVARQRQAQKVQLKKVAQQHTRGHMERANKAREVNGRNYNARRKERSQGANRSHASNNRKCC